MAGYPPYQQPLLDASGKVTKPWQLFFLGLTHGAGGGGAPADADYVLTAPDPALPDARVLVPSASIAWNTTTPNQVSARVVPAGVDGDVQINDGGVLGARAWATLGYWTPITNGDPVSPEILFDSVGDCVVGFVGTA